MDIEILGIEEAITTCDCCGKSNLKRTVAVSVNGDIRHYGCVCATRHTGKTSKQINSDIKARHQASVKAAKAEFYPIFDKFSPVLEAKRNEARSLGLSGAKFAEYCRAESDEIRAIQLGIAAKHGVYAYEI